MVKEQVGLFTCEECGFLYSDRKTAQECENYCRKNHACSIEITKKAVKQG
jgi:hypothetical protein